MPHSMKLTVVTVGQQTVVSQGVSVKAVKVSFSTPSTRVRIDHRSSCTGVPAFIPHDIIQNPKLVALAACLKVTPEQQAIYTKPLISTINKSKQ